jgi:outer membrane protein OmpA-like peptidoglycan-associated protein
MIRRSLIAGVALTSAVVVLAPGARADGVNGLPQVPEGRIAASIHDLKLPVADLKLPVADVDTRSTDGGQTVLSLRSDVLFAFGKSDLSAAASAKIASLVADVKKNAQVKVYGYTDNVGSSASNVRLSRARARSVAAAVRQSRPDLRLTERGYGETHPVASNTSGGKDDPVGRAKNRRVEIRFAG